MIVVTTMEVPGMVTAIFFADPNNIVIELMVVPEGGFAFPMLDDPEPAF